MTGAFKTIRAAFTIALQLFFADPQWIIPNLIAPFVFTLVALLLFRNATSSFGLYAVLGGGLMGMWGNTLYNSGFAIEAERRWFGTIEYVMATPTRYIYNVLGRSITAALTGLLNIILVLLIAQFGFGVTLGIQNPLWFTLELLLILISIGSLGLIFASAFTLSRSTQVATNGLEFPLYVISGAMFPVILLSPYLQPFSYALGATWGVEALRDAATSTIFTSQDYIRTLVNFASIFIYFAIAWVLFGIVEKKMLKEGLLSRS